MLQNQYGAGKKFVPRIWVNRTRLACQSKEDNARSEKKKVPKMIV